MTSLWILLSRGISLGPRRWQTESCSWQRRTFSQAVANLCPIGKSVRPVLTLTPEKMVQAGQMVLDLSNMTRPQLRARDSTCRIKFDKTIIPFPPDTKGVLYFRHIPGSPSDSQLRIRLCEEVQHFAHGSDLLVNADEPWKLSLEDIQSPKLKLQPLLTIIQEEFIRQNAEHISTLVPQNISAGQGVVKRYHTPIVAAWIIDIDASGAAVEHEVQFQGFPAEGPGEGVFYYHHVPGDDNQSQLRFRQCSTTADFAKGEDAIGRTGEIWSLSLAILKQFPSFRPIVNLIHREQGPLITGADVPSSSDKLGSIDPRLPIVTLSPQKLIPLKQQILDISGLSDVLLTESSSNKRKPKKQTLQTLEDGPPSGTDPSDCVPFPAETVGVFYYKQSLTSPTQIGELRFRLCQDLALFDHSEDLAFPTGDPWYIDLQQLCLNEQYRALRDILFREGLVEQAPHLVNPANSRRVQEDGAVIVPSIWQPFPLELSRGHHQLCVYVGVNQQLTFNIRGLFSPQLQSNAAYMGRVIACLEPYPQDVDSSSDADRPLLALRFLEVLAPIRRISDEDCMKRPVPGQLHKVCPPGVDNTARVYRPWGFNNSNPENRKRLQRFIKKNTVKKS